MFTFSTAASAPGSKPVSPTHSGHVHRAPAGFHAKLDHNAVKDFSQIQQMITEHAQILDARSAGRFTGISPEPRPGISSGHMPGATSIPFTELVEGGRLSLPKNSATSSPQKAWIWNSRSPPLAAPASPQLSSR